MFAVLLHFAPEAGVGGGPLGLRFETVGAAELALAHAVGAMRRGGSVTYRDDFGHFVESRGELVTLVQLVDLARDLDVQVRLQRMGEVAGARVSAASDLMVR